MIEPVGNIDIRDLVDLYFRMGDNDQLEGTLTTLHVGKSDKSAEQKVDFRTANRFGDAKARVCDVIATQVGGAQADVIMKSVLKNNPRCDGWSRFWFPNRKAMTKSQLAQVIRLTYQEKARQIGGMTLSERRHVVDWLGKNSAEDPALFMKDPIANSMIHLAASAQDTSRNPRFLDAVHAFERHCEEFKQLASVSLVIDGDYRNCCTESGNFDLWRKLNEDVELINDPDVDPCYKDAMNKLRQEADGIRKNFLSEDASESVEIDDMRRQMLCNTDLEDLIPDRLAHLFDEAKRTVAAEVTETTVNPLIEQIAKKEWKLEDDQPNDALSTLEAIREEMELDAHLRQQGNVLYQKSNHPGVAQERWYHWNHARTLGFGKRAAKAQLAKRSIQKMLVDYFDEGRGEKASAERLARKVMKPWLGNFRALSRHDLDGIIAYTRKLKKLQRGVSSAIRHCKASEVREFDRLEKMPNELLETFSSFCGILGMQYVWNRFELFNSLEQALLSSGYGVDGVDNDQDDNNARRIAAKLLKQRKISHHLVRRLRSLVNGTLLDAQLQEFLKELRDSRAEMAAELAPLYQWFFEHVIRPAQSDLEHQKQYQRQLSQQRGVHFVENPDSVRQASLSSAPTKTTANATLSAGRFKPPDR